MALRIFALTVGGGGRLPRGWDLNQTIPGQTSLSLTRNFSDQFKGSDWLHWGMKYLLDLGEGGGR